MPERQKRDRSAADPSGRERGTIEEFLAFIEDRVKDIEPACAEFVRMARLALADPDSLPRPGRILH